MLYMEYLKEVEGKTVHDYLEVKMCKMTKPIGVEGPVIVGAGPSRLAAAACVKQ